MNGKATICSAAVEVLRKSGKPQMPPEILSLIIENNLYDFKAKNPLSVLKAELRKHAIGVDANAQSRTKYFQLLDDGSFWINDKVLP